MNCEQANNQMQDYIDGCLPDEEAQNLDTHIAACKSCREAYEGYVNIKESLQNIVIPPPGEGFEDRVIAKAVESGSESRKKRAIAIKTFGGSLAAGLLAFWLLSNDLLQDIPATKTGNSIKDYHVIVDDTEKTIKVAIESNNALEGVNMRVELTPNLQLSGFTGRQEINWYTNFNKGVNILSLPITGLASGDGEIITHVKVNGKNKILRIKTCYQECGKAERSVQTYSYS